MLYTAKSSLEGSGDRPESYTTCENELSLQEFVVDTNNQLDYSVRLWMKSDVTFDELLLKYQKVAMSCSGSIIESEEVSTSFNKVAQTGEWTLYEAIINDLSYINGMTVTTTENFTPSIYCKKKYLTDKFLALPKTYIDDVRQQPLDAQTTAYVYDPITLFILTSFDDQNLGLYYQYNDEGKLIRKLKETTGGLKTVAETQIKIGFINYNY